MGFYWKDKGDRVRLTLSYPDVAVLTSDQLFVRRGTVPDQLTDTWTTFEMDLRKPAPIPVAFDFTRFLVSSITFMAHLREVSVYFDDKRLVHLTKDSGTPTPLTVPRNLRPTSTGGFMHIKGLKSARTQFICHKHRFLLTTITFYSSSYQRGCHEMGLQCWDGETQSGPGERTNQA